MIIDVHGHLGHWSFPLAQMSAEELIQQMDAFGIDQTFVSSSLAVRYDFVEGNALLASTLPRTPRIKGYVTVNLNYPRESIQEIHRYLDPEAQGRGVFVGIKIHPMMNRQRFDTRSGLLIAQAAADCDAPILIHTYGSELETPKQVLAAVERHPDLKIILAHSGGFDWQLAMDIADASEHLYAEISSSCSSPDKILQLLEAFGQQRVVFGTDTTLFHPAYSLGMVEDANLPPAVRHDIMGLNAARLFGLKGAAAT
jgi:uncharacterized protein